MFSKKELEKSEEVNGYTFVLDTENNMYECRGDVCYDDEHDEVPEDDLWEAAQELSKKLDDRGYDTDYEYSEKGWVEVVIS
tara:strand:+ start:2403 stop:2645 length:243 start_codon:yes stop_codon:yes gene_type:complete